MQANTQILIFTIAAFILAVGKLLKSYKSDPVGHILLFYFLFGFGPVINYLVGFPIYFGIVEEHIPKATMVMFLGMFFLALPNLVCPKSLKGLTLKHSEPHRWQGLRLAYWGAILYGVVKIVLVFQLRMSGASKIQMINAALPQLHYIYLLLQFYFCAFYLSAKRSGLSKTFWANFVIYLGYCLIIGERDFIFPLFSIFIINSIIENKRRAGLKLILGGAALATFATAIFFFRDTSQESINLLAAILSQGSILFINTYVLKIFEGGKGFFYGETYWNSLLNLLPSWVYKTDYNNLDWFKNQYAAASDSGYGFALDAEGYMNFGLIGVCASFLIIGFFLRTLISKFNNSEFVRYMLVFSVGFIMYALRNDSLALFKGLIYGAIIYLALNTTSYLLAIRANSGRKK